MTRRCRQAVLGVERAVVGWDEDGTPTWGWRAQSDLLRAYAATRDGALLKLRQNANAQAFVERKAAAIERERKRAEEEAARAKAAGLEHAMPSLLTLVAGIRGQGQWKGQIRAPIPRGARQHTRGSKSKRSRRR